MEDIETLRTFFVSQILLAIIILGIIIVTIIRTKHEIINTWIFKMMLIIEFFMVLMVINILTFNIAIIYHIGTLLTIVMMVTSFYLLKKDPEQITILSQNKIK